MEEQIQQFEFDVGAVRALEPYPSELEREQTSFFKMKPPKALELTDRDLEILRFVIEMRFSSVEAVFKKFFYVTRTEAVAKSQAWAQKRLSQLEKAKFLSAVYNFADRTKYFSGTLKAYYALSNLNPQLSLVKPTGGVDQRTFGHDRTLLDLRIQFEDRALAKDWISDRQLRATPELTGGLSGTYVPDAIYTTPSGEKVALELEISTKAKDRYREKVKRYVYLLRSSKEVKPFQRVQFICATEVVKRHLERETKLYPEYFSVEPLGLYLPLKK